MVDIFKYGKSYWYPHMKPRDIEIWERFMEKYPDMYHSCQYDYEVGDVPDFVANSTDIADQNQASLYRLKIDVIGYKRDEMHMIELKPDAGPSTIGQIKGYKALYLRDEIQTLPITPVIITDRERPNMRFLCAEEGVLLFVV